MAALNRLSTFEDRGEGSLGRWLSRIIDLKVREAVRRHIGTGKRSVSREDSQPGSAKLRAFVERGPSPSEVVMTEEARARAGRAMAKLSEDHRRVLWLVQYEQLSMADAAERMDRTRDATKKLYGRALTCFARLLRNNQEVKP